MLELGDGGYVCASDLWELKDRYTIARGDAGMSCPAPFTVESKDELFEHIMTHGEKKHPELASHAGLGEIVRSCILNRQFRRCMLEVHQCLT